jgi:hypothetical protein
MWVSASSFFLGVFLFHSVARQSHPAEAAPTGSDEEYTVDLKWVSM